MSCTDVTVEPAAMVSLNILSFYSLSRHLLYDGNLVTPLLLYIFILNIQESKLIPVTSCFHFLIVSTQYLTSVITHWALLVNLKIEMSVDFCL